jgi:hypothetical protein
VTSLFNPVAGHEFRVNSGPKTEDAEKDLIFPCVLRGSR